MKIIILIIAHDGNQKYKQMQWIWLQYMNQHPNILSFLIKCNPFLKQKLLVDGHTIFVKSRECLKPGIIIKTIKSIQYCLSNYHFDYIVRTNLSSFIHLNNLYCFLKDKTFNYGGPILTWEKNPRHLFVSGSCIFLSKKACVFLTTSFQKNILNNISIIKMIEDDIIISIILKKYTIYKFSSSNIHFRCCGKDGHDKHFFTIQKMNDLFKKFNYGEKITTRDFS